MGEAKQRKAEIEALKRLSPDESVQWQLLRHDQGLLVNGIDPKLRDPEPVAALARLLKRMFEQAKVTDNIDPPVEFLYSTISATTRGLADIPIACKKSCPHCCHTWVSVSAPEALFISKIVKARGAIAVARVQAAHQLTKDYDFDTRDQHPHPCPLLEDDVCSIYDSRPKACRLAASANADICARTYHNLSNEDVPTPVMYLFGRAAYAIALAAALRKVGLPHEAYEFNAALLRAVQTDEAERRWLAGDNIFSDVQRQPADVFGDPQADHLYEHAFA